MGSNPTNAERSDDRSGRLHGVGRDHLPGRGRSRRRRPAGWAALRHAEEVIESGFAEGERGCLVSLPERYE